VKEEQTSIVVCDHHHYIMLRALDVHRSLRCLLLSILKCGASHIYAALEHTLSFQVY
jgi:hypothetical protein